MSNKTVFEYGIIGKGGSTFSGGISGDTFYGSGAGLTGITASGVTGLNLDMITSGTNSAVMTVTGMTVNTGVTATSFITSGGTSSQFIKGDGSLDNNVYSQSGHTHNASGITVTATGNLTGTTVQDALEELQTELSNISPAKELLISKTTFNGIAEPGLYKNGSIAKQITGHRLMSNATDFDVQINTTHYTSTGTTYPIALDVNAELIINDVTIANGYSVGNVILIIQ